ncbi:CoA-binding protein [bacterium]|nr:CoA-binding protein [bacterium]
MKIEEFLNKDNVIAVVGVSTDPHKWGWKIYKGLRSADFKVYPVNPKYRTVEKDICYPKLQTLPEKPDVVITIVPPKITEQIVEECKPLGIGKIWMQPGSESERSINFCKSNGIEVVYNACFVVDGLKKKD